MEFKKAGMAVGALAAAGAIAVGVSNANASTTSAATALTGYTTAPTGEAQQSNDAAVTGAEAAKVSAAVVAKDSAVTVTSVRKDPDGSYDVLGTKAGANVKLEVSADLATITQNAKAGDGGGRGGGSNDAAVTGAEAAKVSAAVVAKDSAVTVTSVRKDPDGSYDVLGTKAGANVMLEVSADLATITQNAKAGDGGGRGSGSNDAAVTGAEAAKVSAAVVAKDSAVTVTSVRKDPDGSYDVLGTKAGANVKYEVSADLATIS